MNTVFLAGLFPNELKKNIERDSKGVIQYAADALQWNFVNGFDYYFRTKIINLPFIGGYPKLYRKPTISSCRFQHVKGANDVSLGFLNLPIIKMYFRYSKAKKELKKWILDSNGGKVIFIYSMHSPFIRAATEIKKQYPEIKICLIIPDLPQYMTGESTALYRVLKAIDFSIIKKALKEIDYLFMCNKNPKKNSILG